MRQRIPRARTRDLARRVLPRWLLRRVRPGSVPAVGRVDFGDLRRTRPLDEHFGYGRGRPVDRSYIEAFLAGEAGAIRGRVLEVGESTYTRRFGGGRVERSDVLHVDPHAPGATIIADLAAGDGIPSDAFDCVILTQTLQLLYDVPAAIRTVHRILAPGGTLLATVPGITQLDEGVWRESWYWSFTEASMRRLFTDHFGSPDVLVESHGNVLAAIAFLEGIAAEELRPGELLAADPRYPVIVTVRATKAGGPASPGGTLPTDP
jgi:SAM-dependent methyltransferase